MSATSNFRAAVIIVNWNGKHLLYETLHALEAQTFKAFRTIVVDNGSTDGSNEYLRQEFPNVKIIALGRNTGFSYANNTAILKNDDLSFSVLLNNDAVPARNWLENLIKALDHNPQAGFAASKMLYYDNPFRIDRVGDGYTNAGVGKLRGRGKPASCYSRPEWIFGACAGAAIYRTEAIKKAGLFDTDFFLINEDVDLSFRLQSLGYRCLYVPDAVVYHKASSTIVHDSSISVFYGHRNLEWVYLKNLPYSMILKTLPIHLVYIALAFAYFITKGHGRTYINAKIDAMAGVPKMLKKRREIQTQRRVTPRYLASLMITERFMERRTIRQNSTYEL